MPLGVAPAVTVNAHENSIPSSGEKLTLPRVYSPSSTSKRAVAGLVVVSAVALWLEE